MVQSAVDTTLAQASEMERLVSSTMMSDVRQLMLSMIHDLRLKAAKQAVAMLESSSNATSLLWLVAHRQAEHQAKLAELRIMRVDVLRQICERGRLLNLAAGQLSEIEFDLMLLKQMISSTEAADCRAIADHADDLESWAYALNGDVVITNARQVIQLVELWQQQGKPEPEIVPVNGSFH